MENLTSEQCRAALARVIVSQAFARSERHRRFLSFVVEETLAGRQGAVKETVIAAEAFDRPTLDPQVDSVVRVEARKLRKRLEDYYGAEGAGDEVEIRIPTGSYVPVFERRGAAPAGRRRSWGWALAGVVLMAAVAVGWLWLRRTGPAGVSSVALLPFAAATVDAELQSFGEGLAGDVTAALTRVAGLRVLPRQATRNARDLNASPQTIGRRLKVDALMDGEVRRTAQGVRVAIYVVSSETGRTVWSREWERESAGTGRLAAEIAQAVAQALGRSAPAEGVAEPDVATRDLYWMARYLRERRGPAQVSRSIELYLQAIARQPQYAAAWAGLAEAYTDQVFHRRTLATEAIPTAIEAAQRAIALDANQATAHASLGRIRYFHEWNWGAAEQEFEKALAAEPANASIHREYGLALASRRRTEESLAHARKAAELDPLASVATYDLALAYWMARRNGECLETARQAAAVNPASASVQSMWGTCLVASGRPAEALAHYEQALRAAPKRAFILGRLGVAYAAMGNRQAALQILGELDGPDVLDATPVANAQLHAALGAKAEALGCLEKAAAARDTDFVFIGAEPGFDGIKAEPRFQALLARLGLN